MRVKLESTTKTVEIIVNGVSVPARIAGYRSMLLLHGLLLMRTKIKSNLSANWNRIGRPVSLLTNIL